MAEPDLGLAGVDVDVDLLRGDLDPHQRDRVAPGRHQRAVGLLDGVHERARGDGAAVRDQVDVAPAPAVEGRGPHQPRGDASGLGLAWPGLGEAPVGGGGEQLPREPGAVDGGHGVERRPGPRRGERLPAARAEPERDGGPGERVVGDDPCDGPRLGARRAQEAPAGRQPREEPAHLDGGAGG